MGDENTVLTANHARHLLRRVGFGAKPDEVEGFEGLTRGEAADFVLSFVPSKFKPGGKDIAKVRDKWLKYMLSYRLPNLQEKLVLFWHDHFATGATKVGNVLAMRIQNSTLRLNCKGNFKTLVKAIGRDPAMIEWLDTQRNFKEEPNENYARELMELFTLGVFDSNGSPNYLQEDIVQIARAFSGWAHEGGKAWTTVFHDYDHDYTDDFPERGPKVIFTQVGGFGAQGRNFGDPAEGPDEIDRVVDIIFDHTDTDGESTVARRTARRLLEYFTHGAFGDAAAVKTTVDQVVAESGFASSWEIAPLVRAILVNDALYESAAVPPFTGTTRKSVRWPIDYIVSTLRVLEIGARGSDMLLAGGFYRTLREHLERMGQVLLEPPSVFGWDWEQAWITSATLLARYEFARDIGNARHGSGKQRLRPERLMDLGLTDAGAIVDAVTELLGVKDYYYLDTPERNALIDYLTDGNPGSPLDLVNDYDTRNRKLHGLFTLVLQSPAYQLQ